MSTSFYRVTITNPGGVAAPGDGFVDPTPLEGYLTSLETTPSGLTYAASTAKKRANIRFFEMISQIQVVSNVYIQISTLQAPGASYDAEPTSIAFTCMAEHGDTSLVTADELNPGQTLTGAAALARCIGRMLALTQSLETDIYDPTPNTSPGSTVQIPRTAQRIVTIEIGAVAASLSAADGLVAVTLLNS